ncbi:MAG TPA: VWA domain-containing protein [Dehalococcoidia bacterium]|nr:VWA domain-containing protein [Dehalococcoidia bacterium]
MTDNRDTISVKQALESFPPTIADEFRAVIRLVPAAVHNRLLELTEEALRISSPAASEFLRTCPFVIERAGPTGLEPWCQEGLELLRKSEGSGIEYFRLGTFRSVQLLEKLSPGVELDSIKKLMETYCLALIGSKTPVLSAELPINRNAIFLPEFVDRYPSKPENFTWYKVMTTHQIGHFEFGSYEFRIDKATSLCRDLGLSHRPVESDDTETDLLKFLNLFDNSSLATDIFTIVEDGRIDFATKQRYRGIRQDYSRIQAEAMSIRPPITSHSLREAFLEIMVRLSLESSGKWLVPAVLRTPLQLASRILGRVMSSEASIDDSTEVMIRLYQLASRIPASRSRIDRWEAIELNSSDGLFTSSDIDAVLRELEWEATDNSPHFSPARVEYRGIFRLEPVYETKEAEATGVDGTETEYAHSPWPASTDTAMLDDILDIGELAAATDDPEETHVFGMNALSEQDTLLSEAQPEQEDDSIEGESLAVDSPRSYLYDEWDFRASDYRLRWCRVREMPLEEGNTDFFEATLDEYARLVAEIRGRFEQLNPRARRKVKRLHDGEDFDLDALVDFVIGKKAGHGSDAKIYWRRNKVERDVSVAFLLDMSSSTVEYINRLQRDSINPVFASDYRTYFEWLQSDHKGKLRPREFKRIIDLEKESIVLLIRALEAIGDNYGIYGFSSHGRENVELYMIKDLEEDFSDRVKSRIDSIIPQRGTRMGPAIRHATWKLEQQESKGKFLFLISDGRPEDHNYGREGLEKEYAIHDTKMALLEARQKGITSLCLTFDREGHDYLRTICGDMQYEVLDDIESLPACLPTLYGWFTT